MQNPSAPALPADSPPTREAGVYLHVPFCRRKCAYCDFASIPCGGGAPTGTILDNYRDGILRELETRAPDFPRADSLYFGGGTPSLLPDQTIAALIAAVRARPGLRREAEITLEVNPCDLQDGERLDAWQAAGINRFSLGIQSLDDAELSLLGRSHDAKAARRALHLLSHRAGLSATVDLIYGLPSQTLRRWRNTLTEVLDSAIGHLSCYQLTWSPGTALYRMVARGRLRRPSQGREARFLSLTHAWLQEAGFPAYEVSNFAASPEKQSRHNLLYWQGGEYLGLGPAAHSFRHHPRPGMCRINPPGFGEWLRQLRHGTPARREILCPEERALELLFLGLRHCAGLNLDFLQAETGIDLEQDNGPLLRELEEQNLLRLQGRQLVPQRDGMFRADGLACTFSLRSATVSGRGSERKPVRFPSGNCMLRHGGSGIEDSCN